MLGIKTAILVGQLGRVWSKNRLEVKVFQSLTALAFFALYLKSQKSDPEKEEFDNFKNTL